MVSWLRRWFCACAAFLALASGACNSGNGSSGGGEPPPRVPPVVTATVPLNGASDVGIKALVSVTFSAIMNPSTIDTSTFVVAGVPGTVSCSGNTAVFRPASVLSCGTSYAATVTTAAKDVAGDALATNHTWTFATRATTSGSSNLVAFVTSVTGSGNLGSWSDAGGRSGLAAADAVCQARAAAAGRSGDFRAWLSDDNDDAYCRLHNLTGKKAANCGQATLPAAAGPWVRTDGHPFAEAADELFAGTVYAPVRFDELGAAVPEGAWYFTATLPDGTLHPDSASPCANWTDGGDSMVHDGTSVGATGLWTAAGSTTCRTPQRLLCLQTGTGPALPCVSAAGKKAFLTSAQGSASLATWADASGHSGIAAGDAICRARALTVGLPNADRFRAWLSTGAIDARDRIASDGPWVRLDGVKVAENKADLTDGSLLSAINVTEAGVYFGNYAVWTGTRATGTGTADGCGDWTSAASSVQGTIGSAAHGGVGWTDYYATECGATARLYCLED